jgi:anti-anti-sigma factor
MGSCAPSMTAAAPASAGVRAEPVATLAMHTPIHVGLERLSAVLDGRQTFHEAQGMLAEVAGCTMRRAGQVLLQRGAQLGFQTSAAVAGYFLINAANAAGNTNSRAALAHFTALASGSDLDHVDARATAPFATLSAAERVLKIRGELDIATVPLLLAAFADRRPGTGPGSSFLLELSDLTFVDVAGLRALAAIQTQITTNGERLRVNPPTSSATTWVLQFAVARGWVTAVFTGSVNESSSQGTRRTGRRFLPL